MWTDRIEDLVDKHPMPWELHRLIMEYPCDPTGRDLGEIILDANGNQITLDEIINAFSPAGSEQ